MSIIIRLQNLPLSARSGDIRNFFGGLRIPDGGVHILGGDKGDAFIAFMSDEDARLAMRKDGGRIKEARVKLFLSSRMEMLHEVGKIAKNNPVESHKVFDETRTSVGDIQSRSYERKRRSHSRQRSLSPDIYNSRLSSSTRYRSRSPRRRSRSPVTSSSQRLSSKSRAFVQRKRSTSPTAHKYSVHQTGLTTSDLSHSAWENSEYHNSESQFPSQNQLQAELEKRITEELEKNLAFRSALDQKCNIPTSDICMRENILHGIEEPYQNPILKNTRDNTMFYSYASANRNVHHIQDAEFSHSFTVNRSQQGNMPIDHSKILSMGEKGNQDINTGFYITMSGLEPVWNFKEVQMILKGIFAPQNHIRWEKDDRGYKTGTVFVKLTNKDDFDNVLKKAVFYFNGRRITVSECPDFIIHTYFQSNFDARNDHYIPHKRDLCYILKGLPFSCTYDDVVNFFHGFEIADIIIFYGEDGRATGTGFVSFTNWNDFEGAMAQNGKKIAHRYIELLPSTDKDMAEAKKSQTGASFVPYSKLLSDKKLPPSRRPLCAILTGLPLKTTTKKIASFFSESGLKPDAIHLTLSKKKLSDGRAFVEFANFLDFDLALKFHGKQLDNNVVCVKQILYDEMMKILDSQRAKHYFEIPAPTSLISTEPEKVPYLWEPPDDEQEKVNIPNICARDNNFGLSSTVETNKLQGDLNHSTSCNKGLEKFFPSDNKKKKYFDPYYKKPAFVNTVSDVMPRSMVQNNIEISPVTMQAEKIEDFAKDVMQSSINKHIPMNRPVNETFHSTKKYEENIKLSRLSPENEAALLNFLNRDRKPPPERTTNRSRSPERRDKNTYTEKSSDEAKKYYKDEKFSKLRSKDSYNSRNRNKRDFRHSDDWKYDSYHKTSIRSDQSYFENDRMNREPGQNECVVQLSNVNVSVGIRELISFLRGFDFYEDTLIRRYTAEGEPTPDVRVTFPNRWEAERAIKLLNKHYLQDRRISMFIV